MGWSGACTGTGLCTVTMNATKSVTAEFDVVQYSLTVSNTGPGKGTVTSSPAGISCGSDCSTTFISSTVVTLTATPDSVSTFAGWSGGAVAPAPAP